MVDTTRLNNIIDRSGIKKKYLAESMGLSAYGLAKKLKGENDFKVSEAVTICRLLGINKANDKVSIFFGK